MRGWRNWQTRTFEGRMVTPCGFKSRSSHQTPTSRCFLLLFETIMFSKKQKHTDESFCFRRCVFLTALGTPSAATAVLFALFQRFHNHEQAQSHYRDYGNRFIPNHLTHSFLKSFFVFAVHISQCRYDYCQ